MSVVYTSIPKARTFKACRSCRSQKARCNGNPNEACERCKATGRDCVFDLLNTDKRGHDGAPSEEHVPKRPRPADLEDEVKQLRSDVNTLLSRVLSMRNGTGSSSRLHDDFARVDTVAPVVSNEQLSLPALTSPANGLSLLQLETPLTTMHAMTGCISSPPKTPSSQMTTPPRAASVQNSLSHPRAIDDVVSKGVLGEADARRLYHLFMAHGNVFLPLFDPVIDTFEHIRTTSTLCFTAVLWVAVSSTSRAIDNPELPQKIWMEVSTLAAQTLFAASAQLEIFQAMILLASYTERNWLAVKHAQRLGEELRLHHALNKLLDHDCTLRSNRLVRPRNILQGLRAWLVLSHIDQEVADGSGRPFTSNAVNRADLRTFIGSHYANASDIRIVSTIEIVQIRGQFLLDIQRDNDLVRTVDTKLQTLEEDVASWYQHWTGAYTEYGLEDTSFQQTSLHIQEGYAKILGSCAIISKLGRQQAINSQSNERLSKLNQLTTSTVGAIMQQLRVICGSDSYRWNFAWAPVYSAIMLTFITALSVRLAQKNPHMLDAELVTNTVRSIMNVLDEYPQPRYAALIRSMIVSASPERSDQLQINHTNRTSETSHSIALEKEHREERQAYSPSRGMHGVARNNASLYSAQFTVRQPWDSFSPVISTQSNHVAHNAENLQQLWSPELDSHAAFPLNWDYQLQNGNTEATTALGAMFDFNAFAASMGT